MELAELLHRVRAPLLGLLSGYVRLLWRQGKAGARRDPGDQHHTPHRLLAATLCSLPTPPCSQSQAHQPTLCPDHLLPPGAHLPGQVLPLLPQELLLLLFQELLHQRWWL